MAIAALNGVTKRATSYRPVDDHAAVPVISFLQPDDACLILRVFSRHVDGVPARGGNPATRSMGGHKDRPAPDD